MDKDRHASNNKYVLDTHVSPTSHSNYPPLKTLTLLLEKMCAKETA